ncbi:major allergen Pru ar 1-like [Olea europaea var. sylvestris]|uniref:major allergen Pru ar 1-like n=1 Tax=Olea europaea var. sylvestris TaxID=158386 RepID=UPI000C1D3891|nr:major allergen Pru ar 1-like [Olea europaea var. sylvestris]
MGVTTFADEQTCPVAPSRIFKASIVDSHNLIPKLIPQAIKSIEFVQGNRGTGSINHIYFAEGIEVKFEASPNGGSTTSKVTSKYFTKGDFVLKEEDINAGKERIGMYNVVEAHLLQNPDACA